MYTSAEQMADAATQLPSFPINLGEVKRSVEAILSQFGKSLMFAEYTVHDITHVNDMLSDLDWIIPSTTREKLTGAEWLLLVLSIYFHDMGLVVTESEYQKRSSSGFKSYCEERLFSGPQGLEYKEKVDELEEEKKDRFLYQEFIRANHGPRVKAWIEGNPSSELGYASAQIGEINRLLSPLDGDFRKDLAIVCESHNLDDIGDTSKYRVSHPYGNSDAETANLQYCAIILRTVDLLQITRGRAPSILYRIISPSDPVSQVEWAKQKVVKRVRAKAGLDREGAASNSILSDTIEVFATFDDPGGFFGLTTYLKYATDQINASNNILKASKASTPSTYDYPWRFVDDSNIQVEGFVKKPFGFELDQDKILDLLTGHTLYNDSNVVVRELVQNALDATRLQCQLDGTDSSISGKIFITWDSMKSELAVVDNGTGMTQRVIEDHLLKVGSSRYQDTKFRDENPEFSPISRFGIGVLSSFMVADSVEIVTVSKEEDFARQISLRSVHGKYLVKLLNKTIEQAAIDLGSHGTSIKLKFRASARTVNVLQTTQTWILFPRCKVYVSIDGGSPEPIGFTSPKAALETYISGIPGLGSTNELRVVEKTEGGITLAFVQRFSAHFRDWSFVGVPQRNPLQNPNLDRPATATCVEGIAVEFQTPGFGGPGILAVANAVGARAPRTNVARSSIEATDEKEAMSATIYKMYFDAVTQESKRLRADEAYSLTWAVEQVPYIIAPAVGDRNQAQYPKAHQSALEDVPMFLVEEGGARNEKSLGDLRRVSTFWTVDSVLTRSVEQFIREAKAEITAEQLIKVSQGTSSALPEGAVVANNHRSSILRNLVAREFQVQKIVCNVAERRIDLQWHLGSNAWLSQEEVHKALYRVGGREVFAALQFFERTRQSKFDVQIPRASIELHGTDGYFAVEAYGTIYVLPETSIASVFLTSKTAGEMTSEELIRQYIWMSAVGMAAEHPNVPFAASVDRFFKQAEGQLPKIWTRGRGALEAAIADIEGQPRIFNPLSWSQRDQPNGPFA